MAIGFQVTFDANDPARLAEFWADALGYVVQPPPPGFESWPAFLQTLDVPESDWNSASAVVDPEVIWACTTCRWCERACPLDITYVDKLVDQRRQLVLEKAEFPEEAQPAFRGYEVNGNPWQLPAEERAAYELNYWERVRPADDPATSGAPARNPNRRRGRHGHRR